MVGRAPRARGPAAVHADQPRLLGAAGRRDLGSDGLYAFVAIETRLDVELEPALEPAATLELLEKAERGCFVSNSLTARPRHHWIVNGREVR